MMHRQWHWTEAERQLLREMWPEEGSVLCARVIGCSRKAVQMQALKLGLGNPRPRKPGWTLQQEADLRILWPSMSCSLIAEELGTTGKAVITKARRMGLPRRLPGKRRPAAHRIDERWWNKDQKDYLRKRRAEGATFTELAAELGVSRGVISGQVFRMGLTKPKRLSTRPALVRRRERAQRKRAVAATPPTELTCDQVSGFQGPMNCQFVHGSPLHFCTNKRVVVAGRVSMYCKEHGFVLKATQRISDGFA